MASVQSSIRAEVKRGEFPAPKGAEAFPAYAIASSKGLIPEMENAARQTLDHPMTFEVLGEGLRLFEGWALRDLASFRKRCRDSLITCLDSFLEVQPPGPSSIWVGCPEVMPTGGPTTKSCSPQMVKSASLTEPERLETSKFHSSTRHTFKNTWGVLHGPPESCELQFLLGGAHEEWFNILRGAREQVGAGTRQGNLFPLLFKYHEIDTSRRYAVIVAPHFGSTYLES